MEKMNGAQGRREMDGGELEMCSIGKNKVSGEGEVKRAYDMTL